MEQNKRIQGKMWNSVPNSGANIHKKGKLIAQIPFLFDFFHAFFMKLTKLSVYSKNILCFLILIFSPWKVPYP